MQIQTRLNKDTMVTVEANNTLELFKELAAMYAVFDIQQCGACQSTNVFPQFREGEDYTYAEMVCKDCWAKLTYGQNKKEESIYPKRFQTDDKGKVIKKDGKAVPIENKGWVKYTPNKD